MEGISILLLAKLFFVVLKKLETANARALSRECIMRRTNGGKKTLKCVLDLITTGVTWKEKYFGSIRMRSTTFYFVGSWIIVKRRNRSVGNQQNRRVPRLLFRDAPMEDGGREENMLEAAMQAVAMEDAGAQEVAMEDAHMQEADAAMQAGGDDLRAQEPTVQGSGGGRRRRRVAAKVTGRRFVGG